ncbi:unnamed protein product (macronuclear) [Paramecium tetraurelia]|uniref:Uncharacterized protein n=1 Tax=Paramecium tetraurelia TaxID=5888 RepID=A0E9V7_PARTE|nr:uncharacterized protein GSPATT00024805001 [Paramecium tetraurelia]CAK92074.1 unnamed protein product [Paramecium tetraurelia]|eukprot:XP_001459471.1 hypothetical protein (macronuclear) [Paramecium tetraurelia strain d4-2]
MQKLGQRQVNELNEDQKIPKMKRVKKRFRHSQFQLTTNPKEGQIGASTLMQSNASQIDRKLQAEIAYNGQQTYAISLQKLQNKDHQKLDHNYLRKLLYFLLCNEIDKIKAFASCLQEELYIDYSLMAQNTLSVIQKYQIKFQTRIQIWLTIYYQSFIQQCSLNYN